MAEADRGGRVDVLVRFQGPAAALSRLGLTLGNEAGGIASATIDVADVPRAAAAPEVVFLELSRPLAFDV